MMLVKTMPVPKILVMIPVNMFKLTITHVHLMLVKKIPVNMLKTMLQLYLD